MYYLVNADRESWTVDHGFVFRRQFVYEFYEMNYCLKAPGRLSFERLRCHSANKFHNLSVTDCTNRDYVASVIYLIFRVPGLHTLDNRFLRLKIASVFAHCF